MKRLIVVAAVSLTCLFVVNAQQPTLTEQQAKDRIAQAKALLVQLEGKLTPRGVSALWRILDNLENLPAQITPDATPPPPTPVACVVSEWSAWEPIGEWSTCLGGSQTRGEQRTRTVTTPASGGGTACPALTETRTATQACTVTPPPPPPTGETGTWVPFTPTYQFANQGRYNTQQWHAQPVDDPTTGKTIIFDRVNDDIRSLYPSSIYANDFVGIDPVAKQVSSVVSSNFRVVPCKPALPGVPCQSTTASYETQPIPNTTPTYVDGHPLAGNLFDPVTRVLLRVNGANSSAQPYTNGTHPRQTWAIDLTTGAQRLISDLHRGDANPPQDVGDYSCGIFDTKAKKYLYFDVTNTGMDTWVLDLTVPDPKWIMRPRHVSATNLWKSVTGCAYDSKRARVLMLGGGRNIYQPLGTGDALPETEGDVHPNRQKFHAYSYDTNSWEELPPIPHSPNIAPEAAYSPVHDVLLVVVRQEATNSVEMLYDTWAFSFASNTWAQVTKGFKRGKVGVRGHSGTLSWNSKHNLFVLTGGTGPAPIFATMRYGTVTPPPPPPPTEICGDGIDNDQDGQIDEGCAPPPPPVEEICGDLVDNDGDGQIDEGCKPPDPEDPPPPPPPTDPGLGMGQGCTSPYFHDLDCDGYGTGVRSSGVYGDVGLGDKVDADDTDPKINTAATVLAAYDANGNKQLDADELRTFLAERRGLKSVGTIYYISPTGDNATGVPNDPTKPYRTYYYPAPNTTVYGVRQKLLKPGDAVVYLAGVYLEPTVGSTTPPFMSGESVERPSIAMASPGESVVFHGNGVGTQKSRYVYVEGFAIDGLNGLGSGLNCSLTKDARIRALEIQRVNWVSCMQDMHDLTIEGVVIHHNREHGLYMGTRNLPAQRVTIRRNIIYRNGIAARYGGLQLNGRFSDSLIERNLIHSNGQWCLTFAMGVTKTRVQNNLCVNNAGHGIILQMYPGHGYDDCTDDPDIPNDVETLIAEPICPHDQSDNVFVNNTIWLGKYNQVGIIPIGGAPSQATALKFGRNSNAVDDPATPINESQREIEWLNSKPQARNTVQNNIIVTDNGVVISEIDPLYLDTWPILNNVIFRVGGDTTTFERGSQSWSLAEFQKAFPLATGNVFADPKFVNVDINMWGTPQLFNFRLQDGSPAIGIGLTVNAPAVDITNVPRVPPLDAGAYRK